MTDLNQIRTNFARVLIALLWAHLPVVCVILLVSGQGFSVGPLASVVLLAGLATAFWWRDPIGQETRLVSGTALVGMAATLLAATAGHSWQIDLHMYFFACLAVLVGWCDWRVILLAAG